MGYKRNIRVPCDDGNVCMLAAPMSLPLVLQDDTTGSNWIKSTWDLSKTEFLTC